VHFTVSGGAQLTGNLLQPMTYSSAGIPWTTTMIECDGAGSLIDLHMLDELSTAFTDGQFDGTNVHTITAVNGGTIDLSGVVTTTPPARVEDLVYFVLSDPDSLIDLSSLQTISGSGGRTQFILSGGAVQSLPSLVSATDVHFTVSGGAQLTGNHLQPMTYSSAGIPWTTTMIECDGAGSLIDLHTIDELSTAFLDGQFDGINTQTISATNGGTIDLSGVTTLTTPQTCRRCVR
jgi:hypothetical protein